MTIVMPPGPVSCIGGTFTLIVCIVLYCKESMRIYCHSLSAAKMKPTVCGFWRYKASSAYADIRRSSLLSWWQIRMRPSKMRVFSFDRYIFRMKFPTGFRTYIEIYFASHGFLATVRLLSTMFRLFVRYLFFAASVYKEVVFFQWNIVA